jgi:hypothetical protein
VAEHCGAECSDGSALSDNSSESRPSVATNAANFAGRYRRFVPRPFSISVDPNDVDKYSNRDKEKKDSDQNPVIQGVLNYSFGLLSCLSEI